MKLWELVMVLVCLIPFAQAQNVCNTTLEIITSKLLYVNESIDFKFEPSERVSDFVIEYWVEDIDENIVKAKRNTTNFNKKSYNPKSSGVQAYLIKAKLIQLNCTSILQLSEKMVLYQGDKEEGVCCECPHGFNYELIEAPSSVYSGQTFVIKIKIDNYDDENHEVSIWSYVYRGSKVYSDSRESNIQQITILPQTSVVAELENIAYADPGEYKLKVKINKDNHKTDKEITTNISIVEKKEIISAIPPIRISDLYFATTNPVNLIVLINNTLQMDAYLDVELNSLYSFENKGVFVESGSEALVSFEIELPEERNPFYVKVYHNMTLVDVQEIIMEDSNKAKEKPFTLLTGDIMLNNASGVYESSSSKSLKIGLYIFLGLSVVTNCVLIYKMNDLKKSV